MITAETLLAANDLVASAQIVSWRNCQKFARFSASINHNDLDNET